MKYQIPVDGWYSDKVSAASARELKDSFGLGREVVIREFSNSEAESAREAVENIAYKHGVRACLFIGSAGTTVLAADADDFSRLSYLYLPAIRVEPPKRAA